MKIANQGRCESRMTTTSSEYCEEICAGPDQTVLIIDSEEMVAAMLVDWIERLYGFKVIGFATTGDMGIAMCRARKPDIVLLDVELQGMDGLLVAQKICRSWPRSRILVLSSRLDPYRIHEISRIGVHGFVNKTGPLRLLEGALRHVAEGGQYYSPLFQQVLNERLSRPDAYQKVLTRKEVAVLIRLAEGVSDEDIGKRLNISPLTVATHRRNVRSKLDAHTDRDLILYARRWGLAPIDSVSISAGASG